MDDSYVCLSARTDSKATAGAAASAEIEVRRSRFLALARRCDTEQAAAQFLEHVRAAHPQARHHCWAYRLGPDGDRYRFSDDGEPAGTAGAPILEAITGLRVPSPLPQEHRGGDQPGDGSAPEAPLSDTCVVVVRWFGGTLLGTGGLVRAYGQVAREVLETAAERGRLVPRAAHLVHRLVCDPGQAQRWENELRRAGMQVDGADWGPETVHLQVSVRDQPGQLDALQTLLAQLSGGRAQAQVLRREFRDV